MSNKDSKAESAAPAAKKPAAKKTAAKKPAAAKKPVKALTFQGREVQIIAESKSRKGQDWDLIDLKFLDEDRVFRIKRKSLDK